MVFFPSILGNLQQGELKEALKDREGGVGANK